MHSSRLQHCLPTCSNRSAALLQLSKTTKALADADECIRLQPDWDKGYFRKASALEVLDRKEEVRLGCCFLVTGTAGCDYRFVSGTNTCEQLMSAG